MKRIQDILNDTDKVKQSFNINDIEKKNPYYIDQLADWLVIELGASNSREYYCKIARYIPRDQLSNYLAIAKSKGKHPAKLFTHLTSKHLKYIGVDQ